MYPNLVVSNPVPALLKWYNLACSLSKYAAVIFGKRQAQQNPPNPPLRKGGIKGAISDTNHSSSPFAKGGPRGILFTGTAVISPQGVNL